MNQPSIFISKNKAQLDVNLIYEFLINSYWAKNRTLEQVKKSIQNSICFGVYDKDKQIGFARVITDQVTFAYLADVFVVAQYRGLGVSKKLIAAILSDLVLVEVKKWYLITKDAQSLYQKFGFVEYNEPDKTLQFLSVPD